MLIILLIDNENVDEESYEEDVGYSMHDVEWDHPDAYDHYSSEHSQSDLESEEELFDFFPVPEEEEDESGEDEEEDEEDGDEEEDSNGHGGGGGGGDHDDDDDLYSLFNGDDFPDTGSNAPSGPRTPPSRSSPRGRTSRTSLHGGPPTNRSRTRAPSDTGRPATGERLLDQIHAAFDEQDVWSIGQLRERTGQTNLVLLQAVSHIGERVRSSPGAWRRTVPPSVSTARNGWSQSSSGRSGRSVTTPPFGHSGNAPPGPSATTPPHGHSLSSPPSARHTFGRYGGTSKPSSLRGGRTSGQPNAPTSTVRRTPPSSRSLPNESISSTISHRTPRPTSSSSVYSTERTPSGSRPESDGALTPTNSSPSLRARLQPQVVIPNRPFFVRKPPPTTAIKKRRGRPPGSKNKPKLPDDESAPSTPITPLHKKHIRKKPSVKKSPHRVPPPTIVDDLDNEDIDDEELNAYISVRRISPGEREWTPWEAGDRRASRFESLIPQPETPSRTTPRRRVRFGGTYKERSRSRSQSRSGRKSSSEK